MNSTCPNNVRRLGFTLIEVLVVIAIIAILAALFMGGVMVFLRKGPEMKTRNDIAQLSIALDKFYGEHKRYPPHQIRLRANMDDYARAVDTLDMESVGWINTFWPHLRGVTNIPWAGATAMPASGVVLDGDQCLVFFLGGPPVGGGLPGLQGFSTNPLNPADSTTADRKKFFDFEVARLANRAGNPFPSYLDGWGKMPYMYFSSGKRADGYFNWPQNTTGIAPYYSKAPAVPLAAPTGYYHPTKFQLISAGLNEAFGPGGFWTPATATSIAAPGRDDFSNFHEKPLGIP